MFLLKMANIVKIHNGLIMRKLLILLIILFSSNNNYANETGTYSVGPFFSLKGGINGTNTPDGRKNGIAFNGIPDFGLSLKYNMGKEANLGLIFSPGYSTYSYQIKNSRSEQEGGGIIYDHKYSYFTFGLDFAFENLITGFNFGIPLSADMEGEINTDHLQTLAEFRIGAGVPLIDDESGRLDLIIYAGYMLSGIYSDFSTDDPLKDIVPVKLPQKLSDEFNPRVVSVSFGFRYFMKL